MERFDTLVYGPHGEIIYNDFGSQMTLSEAIKIFRKKNEPYSIKIKRKEDYKLRSQCDGVYVRSDVLDFLSKPENHDFVKFMIDLNSENKFFGYCGHDSDYTYCCNVDGDVYLFNGHEMIINQTNSMTYNLSRSSSGMCLIPNSNLKMFVSKARQIAIRKGMDISKVSFPKCVVDETGYLKDHFDNLGLTPEVLKRIYGSKD